MKFRDTLSTLGALEVDAVTVAPGAKIPGVREVNFGPKGGGVRWFVEGTKPEHELRAGWVVVTRPDGVREYVTAEQFAARFTPIA
jgi:hypothetical protein